MREEQRAGHTSKDQYVSPSISVHHLLYEDGLLGISIKGGHQGAGNGSGSATNTPGGAGGGAGEAEDLTEIGGSKSWGNLWEDEEQSDY